MWARIIGPKQTLSVRPYDILDPLEELAVLKIDCEWAEYEIFFAALHRRTLEKIAYITAQTPRY